MDEMDEIIEEFLVESHENLDRLDSEFVRLESNPDDVDVLAGIFRDIHTIKGTSGFLGYAKLESVAHVGENLLSKLRDGELDLTAERTSALLTMVDAVREILTSIESSGTEGDGEYAPLIARLEAAQQDDATTEAPAAAAELPAEEDHNDGVAPIGEILARSAGVSDEQLRSAMAQQQAGDPRHIGELLVEQGAVQSAQVVEALRSQKQREDDTPARTAADSTIRVDVDLLDELMNLVGELVLARNQIMQFSRKEGLLFDTAQRLNLLTTELQDGVMKTRMQPIGTVFNKFPRVVRDIALSLGKQVTVTMEGVETELDKTIIEAIKDPLTHMVRNSVDHGIEPPDIREQVGKAVEGRLHLRAYHESGQVIVEIEDDGAGIDPGRVAEKAISNGLITPAQAQQMQDRDLVNMVFAPGFSTAETVSNISGRGVGMDVVRTSIERIGGSVELSSTLGSGTVTRIRIPLTLAIIPALIVTCREEHFAIAQVSLVELLRVESSDVAEVIETVHGTPVYRLRGRLLPLVYLDEQLGFERDADAEADRAVSIVVLQADTHQFGLVVDDVDDTAEIVVKPLGQVLKHVHAYAGATIMGDGRVALILDVPGIAAAAGLDGPTTSEIAALQDAAAAAAARDREMLLVMGLGAEDPELGDHRVCVPLRQVARLEEIPATDVERASGRPVVQYRGDLLPLVRLADTLGTGAARVDDSGLLQVVVYERANRAIGFIVDRIVDVIEDVLEIQRPSTTLGLRGSAVVDGRVTDVLDVEAIITREAPDMLEDMLAQEATR